MYLCTAFAHAAVKYEKRRVAEALNNVKNSNNNN